MPELDPSIKQLKPRSSYLNAFCILPKVRFENQQSDETVILMLRAHPVTFLPWISIAIFLLFFPIILNVILPNFISTNELVFINIFWYTALYSYVLINLTAWLFNVGIITNKRIVDVDYFMVIHKVVSATVIEDVADITAQTTGFLRSLLNYGDIFVQTAGTEQNIDFPAVPNPNLVVAIINELAH